MTVGLDEGRDFLFHSIVPFNEIIAIGLGVIECG